MESGTQNQKTTEFLSLLEHELRTILNGYVGATQLLSKLISRHQQQNEAIEVSECRKFVESLHQSNQQYQHLLDQLQDFREISQGELKIHSSAMDFSQLLQTVARPFSMLAKEKQLEFSIHYHQDASPIIYGDTQRLRQILYNLLDNAVKSTKSGKIEIEVTPDELNTSIILKIKDTGQGVSREQLDRIFNENLEPAHRLESQREYDAFELGMTLVKHLVELQNGKISVSSEINHGTSITIMLPVQVDYNLSTEVLRQIKLLLITDECDWMKGFENDLIKMNLSFRRTSLNEANSVLIDWAPDLIVISSKMVTQQITYFARTLKSNRQLKQIRLVLVLPSGKQYIYDREQALISGCDSVVNNMPVALFIETLATAWSSWKQNGEIHMAEKPLETNHRVLVVEDNLINQKVVRLLLSELGLNVDVANNGAKALTAIEQNEYSLVFVDIGLPDINGFEVIKQIRERNDRKAKLPIIVLSADARHSDERDYSQKGVDAYLVKPITIQQLRSILAPFFPSLMAGV